jgi:hypothetical protein
LDSRVADVEQPGAEPENDGGDDTDDDKTAEELEEEAFLWRQGIVDKAMEQWAETTPEDVRQAAFDHFTETGEIDTAKAGIDENMAHAVVYSYAESFERNALKQFGLTLDTYLEHVDETDHPAIRRLVAGARWDVLAEHAHRIAKARRENELD